MINTVRCLCEFDNDVMDLCSNDDAKMYLATVNYIHDFFRLYIESNQHDKNNFEDVKLAAFKAIGDAMASLKYSKHTILGFYCNEDEDEVF